MARSSKSGPRSVDPAHPLLVHELKGPTATTAKRTATSSSTVPWALRTRWRGTNADSTATRWSVAVLVVEEEVVGGAADETRSGEMKLDVPSSWRLKLIDSMAFFSLLDDVVCSIF